MASMYLDSKQEREWLRNLEHKLDLLLDQTATYESVFLDPRQLELADQAIRKRPSLSFTVYGGYPHAERNMIYVFPSQQVAQLPSVSVIHAKWSPLESGIGQRDILGAVLSLGLKRDQVGDIIFTENNSAYIVIAGSKASYLTSHLTRAGSVSLQCVISDLDNLPVTIDNGKDVSGTVASMRIDAVIALGFKVPRSRVVLLVKGGLARVNWRSVTSPSYLLKEGDQISLKGKGRLTVNNVEGETKKGRIRLKMKKYS